MSNYTIELPIRVDVEDYHEFSYLEKFFKLLNEDIKVEEVGFDGSINAYIGIAYVGTLSKDEEDELLENVGVDAWAFDEGGPQLGVELADFTRKREV